MVVYTFLCARKFQIIQTHILFIQIYTLKYMHMYTDSFHKHTRKYSTRWKNNTNKSVIQSNRIDTVYISRTYIHKYVYQSFHRTSPKNLSSIFRFC